MIIVTTIEILYQTAWIHNLQSRWNRQYKGYNKPSLSSRDKVFKIKILLSYACVIVIVFLDQNIRIIWELHSLIKSYIIITPSNNI